MAKTSTNTRKPSPFFGTWLGGFIGHCILIPLWTLSPVPLFAAIIMFLSGGRWTVGGLMLMIIFAILSCVRFPYRA